MRALRQGDRVRILWFPFDGRCGTIDTLAGGWAWVEIDGDSDGPRFLSPDDFELWNTGLDVMLELVPG